MDQQSTPQYQGLMQAFGQKKKPKPEPVAYMPPPVQQPAQTDPYMNFAEVATGQQPVGPQGPQRKSVLTQFLQKMRGK